MGYKKRHKYNPFMTIQMNSIQELIENTANDPELAASIDIEKLLEASQENRFLGKSMETVTKDIIEVLGDPLLNLDKTEISDISSKLLGYQYIDRVCDVRLGRFIRWIKRCTSGKVSTLYRGGIVTSIQVEDTGMKILCRNKSMQFSRLKWDDCIIFQQLSLEEKMILSIGEQL